MRERSKEANRHTVKEPDLIREEEKEKYASSGYYSRNATKSLDELTLILASLINSANSLLTRGSLLAASLKSLFENIRDTIQSRFISNRTHPMGFQWFAPTGTS